MSTKLLRIYKTVLRIPGNAKKDLLKYIFNNLTKFKITKNEFENARAINTFPFREGI